MESTGNAFDIWFPERYSEFLVQFLFIGVGTYEVYFEGRTRYIFEVCEYEFFDYLEIVSCLFEVISVMIICFVIIFKFLWILKLMFNHFLGLRFWSEKNHKSFVLMWKFLSFWLVMNYCWGQNMDQSGNLISLNQF